MLLLAPVPPIWGNGDGASYLVFLALPWQFKPQMLCARQGGGSSKTSTEGHRARNNTVPGTCEEMCFEKRREEMIVAQGVTVLGC